MLLRRSDALRELADHVAALRVVGAPLHRAVWRAMCDRVCDSCVSIRHEAADSLARLRAPLSLSVRATMVEPRCGPGALRK